MSQLKYLSVFSGIGGFELAIKKSSAWDCIGYSEVNKYAIKIYEKHFKGKQNYGDAKQINTKGLPDFDLLVGGFPCQPFSVAGERRGFTDSRGSLFFEVARIIKEKQPRILLLENVKGLLSHDKGATFIKILTTLNELGYDAEWQVLNSKYFGVPQSRERVFIIGYLRKECSFKIFPVLRQKKEANERSKSKVCISVSAPNRIKKGQNGRRFKDNNDPSFTLTAQDRHGIYDGANIRTLTPLECERLQGFPDNWTEGIPDNQRYKCIGNAITVNVVEEIIKRLKENVLSRTLY